MLSLLARLSEFYSGSKSLGYVWGVEIEVIMVVTMVALVVLTTLKVIVTIEVIVVSVRVLVMVMVLQTGETVAVVLQEVMVVVYKLFAVIVAGSEVVM